VRVVRYQLRQVVTLAKTAQHHRSSVLQTVAGTVLVLVVVL